MIHLGDCIEKMRLIPDDSIDLCLTDPPYGTTACKWDTVIPFDPMWSELKRIVKDNGAICLFGTEPFSSHLRMSNIKMFKYDWIWVKNRASNIFLAKKQPLRVVENISIFFKKSCFYYPELLEYSIDTKKRNNRSHEPLKGKGEMYQETVFYHNRKTKKGGYPKNILKFNLDQNNQFKKKSYHPTQKPVPLLEYLIKTYTLEDETVLDFTMGSGSTGVACKHLNRQFIGIERDPKYFEIAKNRINDTNFCLKSD